jgi:hypothetical protein
MKSTVLYILIAGSSLTGLHAYAQGTCHTDGGQYPGAGTGVGSPSPYVTNNGAYPSAAQVQAFLSQASSAVATPTAVSPAAPVGPQARITVLDSAAASSVNGNTVSATPAMRITVVPEGSSSVASSEPKPATTDEGSLPEAMKGLVGNWTAVARVGDNELTTVELQLDDRGWATLSVPGSDGKKSTIKRRVELKNDEIKLTGPEAETVLGKLVSVNNRQMVLEKAGGQVTFVRM